MKCFVIMPIGDLGSEKYRQYLAIYEHIIKEAVEPLGFKCERADEIPDSGVIPDQIHRSLKTSELVIADLTEKNPNVMYEVGLRHAMGRPIVSIAQDVRGLPFDISHYRTILYDPCNLNSVSDCRKLIGQYVNNLQPLTEAVPSGSQASDENRFDIGLENIFRILGELVPKVDESTDKINLLSDKLNAMGDEPGLKALTDRLQDLLSTNQLVTQMGQLGLVGIHKNRLDAMEHYFFNVLREEPSEIDIVGSTIFGLKGYRSVTFEKIIELLRAKRSDPDFKLRILLTHWEFISFRQDQERTEKNIARYVISKELKDAIEILETTGLKESVKFYKGSPTCFTIIADGQKQMLMNPYPYQREAYNSWCVVVRETFGGVYSDFKRAHFDEPWSNSQLTVPLDDQCQRDLEKKLEADITLAREQILGQLKTTSN